jgi:AcrR family transcriptional regulator
LGKGSFPIVSEARLEDLPARERQWLRTHRRIMAASLEEFERVGVDAARVEHICKAAGVTRPTFYAHFPSKDDVLFEMQRGAAERVAEQMTTKLEEAASLREVVDLLADGLFYTTSLASPRLRRELGSLFVRKQGVADWENSSLHDALVRCFRAAQESGEIAAGSDPAALTRWVFVTLFGFLVADPIDLEPSRSEARKFLHVLMAGLRDGSAPA